MDEPVDDTAFILDLYFLLVLIGAEGRGSVIRPLDYTS